MAIRYFSITCHFIFFFAMSMLFFSCSPSEPPDSIGFECVEEIECMETIVTMEDANCENYNNCSTESNADGFLNDPWCKETCSSTIGCNWNDNSTSDQCNYESYYCNDLFIIQKFIDENSETFKNHLDKNANGCIEPQEFGKQIWRDTRLINLDLGFDIAQITNYQDNVNYKLRNFPIEFNGLEALEQLKLNNNEFDLFPEGISQLTNLKKLDLSDNLIAFIPDEVGNLSSLEELLIYDNAISYIPASIGNLQSLIKLQAQNNNLTYVSNALGNLNNLESLFLNNNRLDEAPSTLNNLTNLKFLYLNDNEITKLPDELCENGINGPSAFTESGLIFNASNNAICPWTCDDFSTELECPNECEWIISNNNNSGQCEGTSTINQYPDCISGNDLGNQDCGDCPPIHWYINNHCVYAPDYQVLEEIIRVNEYSDISGGQPEDFYNPAWWDTFIDPETGGEKSRLVEITLTFKKLHGEIPLGISSLSELRILRLEGNLLTGSIPNEITNLQNLKILKLQENLLTGTLPNNIGLLVNLDSLWVYDNQLEGSLPQDITNLNSLGYLGLHENNFTGSIPSNIGDLSNLQVLRLNLNNLSGEIPESITNLTKLRRLVLADNNLSGEIPENFCTFINSHNLPLGIIHYLQNNAFCPGINGYPDCLDAFEQVQQNTSNCP